MSFGILEENKLCSLATVTADCRAHASTAYFAYSNDLALYFLSHPRSAHCRNLEGHPFTSATVFSSSQEWDQPDRGLQLFGTCEPASGRWAETGRDCYARRYPLYAMWGTDLGIDEPARSYRLYRLSVLQLKACDERSWGDGLFVWANLARADPQS